MFVESMILHAQTEAQRQPQDGRAAPHQPESSMEKTPQSAQQPNQPVVKTAPMQQSQTQSQRSRQQSQQSQGVPQQRQQCFDPLGRPMYQGSPRFTDQQVGGDLTGDESDARDDNFVITGSGQNARDVSAHAERVPAASAEAQRYMAVAGKPPPTADAALQPDGSEDPGANADDGMVPRQRDGSASEQH